MPGSGTVDFSVVSKPVEGFELYNIILFAGEKKDIRYTVLL